MVHAVKWSEATRHSSTTKMKNAEQTRNEEQKGREKYGKYEDPNPTPISEGGLEVHKNSVIASL